MKHKLYFRGKEGERKGQKVVLCYSKEKVSMCMNRWINDKEIKGELRKPNNKDLCDL
jgi:hypothetical protein